MTSFFNDLSEMHNDSYPALTIPQIPPIPPIPQISIPVSGALLMIINSMDLQKQKLFLASIMPESLNKSNFSALWNSLIELADSKLNTIFLNYLQKNINDYDDLIKELDVAVINFIVDSKTSNLSELEIFIIVSKWINHKSPSEQVIKQLLSKINFPTIGSENLIKIVWPTGLISDRQCLQAINDSYDDTKIHSRNLCKIGIGYANKSYPGFRSMTKNDITDPNIIKLFKLEYKKNNGFMSLDEISLGNLHKDLREINVDKTCICFNNSGIARLYLTNQQYRTNSVCEISFTDNLKNEKCDITSVGFFYVCSSSNFTFFVKI